MKKILLSYWKPATAVIFWGASFVATKIVLNELTPVSLIFSRLFLGSIFLFVLAIFTRRDFTITIKNHGWIFILALIGSFHLWIQVTGLQYTTASNTGWIIGLTPAIMTVMGFIFFKESLNLVKISGIIIAFLGLVLLISHGSFTKIGLISNKGDFLVLASAFTWSIYSMVNKKISAVYSPLMTILFLFAMMALLMSPFTISAGFIHKVFHLSVASVIAILFLGIFCSGIAYVLWAKSLNELGSARSGAFLYFEPFVTVLAAWLLLKENITLLIILSGVVITIGVAMVNLNLRLLFFKKRRLKTDE